MNRPQTVSIWTDSMLLYTAVSRWTASMHEVIPLTVCTHTYNTPLKIKTTTLKTLTQKLKNGMGELWSLREGLKKQMNPIWFQSQFSDWGQFLNHRKDKEDQTAWKYWCTRDRRSVGNCRAEYQRKGCSIKNLWRGVFSNLWLNTHLFSHEMIIAKAWKEELESRQITS